MSQTVKQFQFQLYRIQIDFNGLPDPVIGLPTIGNHPGGGVMIIRWFKGSTDSLKDEFESL
jgi:hypothetical protein